MNIHFKTWRTKKLGWTLLVLLPFVTSCSTMPVSGSPAASGTPNLSKSSATTGDTTSTGASPASKSALSPPKSGTGTSTQSSAGSSAKDNSASANGEGPASSQTTTHADSHALSALVSGPPTARPSKNYSLGVPKPHHIHGIYLTAYTAGNPNTFDYLVNMVRHSSLNSMVIDVKIDDGDITFPTNNPKLKPFSRPIIPHPREMMATLKANHIYPIARLCVFEDTLYAQAHPKDSYRINGKLWYGLQGEAYTNPFVPAVWKYNVEVAEQAAKLGFEQIQFDFVRFPAAFPSMLGQLQYSMGPFQGREPRDEKVATQAYRRQLAAYDTRLRTLKQRQSELERALQTESIASTAKSSGRPLRTLSQAMAFKRSERQLAAISRTLRELATQKPQAPQFSSSQILGGLRVDAVTDFIKYARRQLQPYHVQVAVDILGYTATIHESTSVGQSYRRISKNVDVISPMIYPSLWGYGYFGISRPDLHPYQVVMDFERAEKKSLAGLAHPPVQIPWIQDYTASYLGAGNYQYYNTAQVQQQIEALRENGIDQYFIWNPANVYSPGI
ncbi:putative glycoside hydrolase [Alicyclobacillus sp. SP_1]|uniref:putative glycoside hydrolase n=1 Tax=Alicyclobacillus sp. SP_1 TaxID=2942475 RepID=UPI0021576450|nr:putative glycoside hydrolase [Alicyclobacillus sp. SP_1]